MKKVDAATFRDAVLSEYRDFPNPGNDPILAFEARGAAVIADFSLFVVQENNDRQTPTVDIVNGIVAITAIPLGKMVDEVPPEDREQAIDYALNVLRHYLMADGTSPITGELAIPMKDVGDA